MSFVGLKYFSRKCRAYSQPPRNREIRQIIWEPIPQRRVLSNSPVFSHPSVLFVLLRYRAISKDLTLLARRTSRPELCFILLHFEACRAAPFRTIGHHFKPRNVPAVRPQVEDVDMTEAFVAWNGTRLFTESETEQERLRGW